MFWPFERGVHSIRAAINEIIHGLNRFHSWGTKSLWHRGSNGFWSSRCAGDSQGVRHNLCPSAAGSLLRSADTRSAALQNQLARVCARQLILVVYPLLSVAKNCF